MKNKICVLLLFFATAFSQSAIWYAGGSGADEITYTDNQYSVDKTTFIIKGTPGYKTLFYWGDNTFDQVTFTSSDITVEHTYVSTGTYKAVIRGNITKITKFVCNEIHVLLTLSEIKKATALTFLHLSGNNFSGTINDLSTLTSLTYLYLNSGFTGSIANISGLTNLVTLHLEGTACTGIITSTQGMVSLITLYLMGSGITGDIDDFQDPIPQEFPTLDSLTYYSIYSITGNLGDIEATYPNLIYLYLYDTPLSGSISDFASASEIVSMRYLFLNSNSSITITFSNIAALTELNYLNLSSGSGTLATLNTLNHLTVLNLYYSNNYTVTGNISALAGLTLLTDLRFPYGQWLDTFLSLNSLMPLTALITLYCQAGPDLCYAPKTTVPVSWKNLHFTNTSFGPTSVDSLLINLNANGSSSGILYIDGSTPSRTSASDVAIAALRARSWIINE